MSLSVGTGVPLGLKIIVKVTAITTDHSLALLRRALHIPTTYYTKIVNPTERTEKTKGLDVIVQMPPPSVLLKLGR